MALEKRKFSAEQNIGSPKVLNNPLNGIKKSSNYSQFNGYQFASFDRYTQKKKSIFQENLKKTRKSPKLNSVKKTKNKSRPVSQKIKKPNIMKEKITRVRMRKNTAKSSKNILKDSEVNSISVMSLENIKNKSKSKLAKNPSEKILQKKSKKQRKKLNAFIMPNKLKNFHLNPQELRTRFKDDKLNKSSRQNLIEVLNEKINDIERESASLEREELIHCLKMLLEENHELEGKIENLNFTINEKTSKNITLREKIEKLQKTNKESFIELDKKISKQAEEIDDLISQNEQLCQKLSIAKKDKQMLRTISLKKEDKIKAFEEKYGILSTNRSSFLNPPSPDNSSLAASKDLEKNFYDAKLFQKKIEEMKNIEKENYSKGRLSTPTTLVEKKEGSLKERMSFNQNMENMVILPDVELNEKISPSSSSVVNDLTHKVIEFEKKLQQLKLEKMNDTREINFLREQNSSLLMKYKNLKGEFSKAPGGKEYREEVIEDIVGSNEGIDVVHEVKDELNYA